MKFTGPEGKIVNFTGKLLMFKKGKYETENKDEQEVLKKCKGVKSVKAFKDEAE
jgi:hypothetical protein